MSALYFLVLSLSQGSSGQDSLQLTSSQLWWGVRTPLHPRFLPSPHNVTALVGQEAFLPCRVEHLSDRSVTWMRKRDLHILTADLLTYSADDRFKVIHSDNSDDWTLRIQSVGVADDGVYECQVNSDPKISRSVFLKIRENKQLDDPAMLVEVTDMRFPDYNFGQKETEKRMKKFEKKKKFEGIKRKRGRKKEGTFIHGSPERHLPAGSGLSLLCVVHHQSRKAPENLVWLKQNRTLHQGVSVQTENLRRRTLSKLDLALVTAADSGRYTCSPGAPFPQYSVMVNVQSEPPAAVYQSGLSSFAPPPTPSFGTWDPIFLCSLLLLR